MTHPPHPPSEMVAAMIAAMQQPTPYFYTKEDQEARAAMYIRTMFSHVDRAAMIEDGARRRCRQEAQHRFPGDLVAVLEYVDRGWRRYITEVEVDIDAALAAALAAALPSDA